MNISERTIDEDLLLSLINVTQNRNAILAKPKIISELRTAFLKTKAFSNLEDVFGSKPTSFEIQNETLFRVKPFLVGFQPQNLQEFCRSYCSTCQETFSFNEVRQLCPTCFREGKPVFEVVLYLKDEHSLTIDEVYKVYYYSPVESEDFEDPQLFGF